MKIQEMLEQLPERVRGMHGYVPGLQKNDSSILKLNSNENPYRPSRAVFEALQNLADPEKTALEKYPSPRSHELRGAIETTLGLSPDSVLAGNGSDEILAILFRGLMDPGDTFVMPDPTYSLYPVLARAAGLNFRSVPLKDDFHIDFEGLLKASRESTSPARVAIMAMPNAPTGLDESAEDLERFIQTFPGWVILDEAYSPFAEKSFMTLAGNRYANLICTSTFSKAWSLAGLRIGWMVAHPELIQQMDKIRDSYNLSRAAQVAARAAILDVSWQTDNANRIKTSREKLIQGLTARGFRCIPSSTNFVLARVPAGSPEQAARIQEEMEKRNILIRYFSHPRVREYLRISVGTDEQMDRVLASLDEILD
ncbi:MAG TPA: histidinol-phosphate transaminase [Leptospiraceae bacterium]|nr:histidinol-phosphate transaminase [Leptospiraceae bacterium]